jgi:hypothetical protein
MTAPGRTGLRRTDPSRLARTVRLPLTGAVPAHPLVADHLAAVPAWNGATNQQYGTCVTPDTRVLTADLRWVPAGDLSPGEHLLGFDEELSPRRRSYRRSTVVSTAIVRKPCYDLTFEDGTTVRCSSDHKWLVRGSHGQHWVTAAELKCGPQNRSRVVKPLDVWEADTSRDAGYLAAAFDGEGNLDQGRQQTWWAGRLRFVQADNQMLTEVERCLKELDYPASHKVHSAGLGTRTDGTPRHDKHVLDINRRADVLRFLGSVRPARLLPKLDVDRLGQIGSRNTRLVSKVTAGDHDVVLLETSARTYFAEGLASHNCGPCMVANSVILTWRYLLGVGISVADRDIYDLYRRSGNPDFDPDTGAGDNGVDMTVMLSALVRGGIWVTHSDTARELVKPLCFASAPTQIDLVRAITSIFGGAALAVTLQDAQQDQTADALWDYSPSAEWGGHAVLGGAYTSVTTAHHADEAVVTWQQPCGTTDAFMAHQLNEVYVIVWAPLWDHPAFQAGVDQAQLAADYTQATGKVLPVVPPGPVPPPGASADQVLWQTAGPWAGAVRTRPDLVRLQAALITWAHAKGL